MTGKPLQEQFFGIQIMALCDHHQFEVKPCPAYDEQRHRPGQ